MELSRSADLNRLGDRIVINVSGERYETLEETLARYPDTLLGSPNKRLQYFDPRYEEYFFNRNRQAFDAILFYYQSYGRLVKPEFVPESIFLDEVRFFQIHSDLLLEREKIQQKLRGKEEALPENAIQQKVWLLFSRPESSFAARVIGVLSVLVISTSIIIPCIESQVETINSNPNSSPLFATVEMICYVWFTFEFAIRLVAAPGKLMFLRRPLNIIDFVSVTPYYLVLLLKGTRTTSTLPILRTARMLRVLRIFKLSRYSSGMRILIYTFSSSAKELGMFLIFILVCIVVSSSAAFYADYGDGAGAFTSIPDAFWWSINTITTVGYGDQYPYSTSGKLVGCVLTVFGVLVVALPVFLFVSNFKRVLLANSALVQDAKEERKQRQ